VKKSISFPIVLLQLKKESKKLLNSIMIYTIIDFFRNNISYYYFENKILVTFSKGEKEFYQEIEISKIPENENEALNIIAREFYGVVLPQDAIAIYKEIIYFLTTQKKGSKKFVYTKIGWKFYKEVYFKKKITFRELKIIFAINSILGNELYKRITYRYILARYHGYEKVNNYINDINNNNIEPEITERQLRYTIDKLFKLNFFRIITYRNREIYYSTHFKTEQQLLKAIGEMKANRELNKKSKSKSNRNYSDQIDSIKQSKLKLLKKVV
jgi:hypothetical protein